MATNPEMMRHDAPNMRLLSLKLRPKPPTLESIMANLRVDKNRAEEILSFAREKLPERVRDIVARFMHGESGGGELPHPSCSAVSEIIESLCPTGTGSCECREYECEEHPSGTYCEPLT